jgi:hypothetical protein
MYKGTDNEYHIGPMAQDFHASFNVGLNNTSISTIDPAGVALIGIQELSKQVSEKDNKINELTETVKNISYENKEIKDEVKELKSQLEALRQAQIACCRQMGNLDLAKALDIAVLEQNNPNPFKASESTVIRYYTPQTSTNVYINLTDVQGKLIQSFKITQNGNGQIIVPSQLLVSSGTYYYNLVINDTQVDSKKMVLVK